MGDGPCRTIAKALRLARASDRIVLADSGEPYRECITLQGAPHSGGPERPFVIVGNGAVLDGSQPVHPDLWEHVADGTYRFQPKRTRHQQLFLNSRPLVRVRVDNNNLTLPRLQPMQWCLFDRHVYLNLKQPTKPEEAEFVPEDVLELAKTEGWRYVPQQYDLSHTHHTVGVTLYDVRNIVVADLTVQGFQLDGINAHDKAFNTQLIGVVCRGNGRSGITVAGASRVKITESLMGNNGEAQLRVEGYCVAEVVDCEILAFSAPAIIRDGGDVSIDGLPLRGNILKSHVDPPRKPIVDDAAAP